MLRGKIEALPSQWVSRGSLSGLDDNGIVQTLREIEEISRRTHSVMLEVIAEADTRGVAAREGFGSSEP